MTEKLLPCPFCGECPVLTEAMTEHWVSCGTCGASGGMRGRLELAITAWNRRTPAPEGEAWRTVPREPTAAMHMAGLDIAERRATLEAIRPTDTGWRDIATAPKEKGEYLVGWSDGDVMIGWWNSRLNEIDWQDSLNPGEDPPTHWMPLPPAPTDTGASHD